MTEQEVVRFQDHTTLQSSQEEKLTLIPAVQLRVDELDLVITDKIPMVEYLPDSHIVAILMPKTRLAKTLDCQR